MVAGFLMAIWPSEVAYVTVLASEIPFTFFVLLGCTALVRVADCRIWRALS